MWKNDRLDDDGHTCLALTISHHYVNPLKSVKEDSHPHHNENAVKDFSKGKNEDVKNVLLLLKKTRLVTITGEPGIGKTYIAKRVANYIAKW